MKLLFKTIYHKQKVVTGILITLVLITLFALQLNITTNFKQDTLVARIAKINGTHTNIIVSNDEFYERALTIAKKYGEVEETHVFPASEYNPYFQINTFGQSIHFEAHLASSKTEYQIISGKPLADLQLFEVAISENLARKIRATGTEPLGYELEYQLLILESYELKPITFVVKTIFDYPNVNDVTLEDDLLADIAIFSREHTTFGLMSEASFEKIYELHWGETTKEAYSYWMAAYQPIIKVRFNNYTIAKEQQLETELLRLNDTSFNAGIEVIPLHFLAQQTSTSETLFQQLSFYLVGGLIISTIYTFYVFLRRQLQKQASTIGTLSLLGVSWKKIRLVYFYQLAIIFLSSMGLWLLMNLALQQLYLTDRTLAAYLDFSQVIIFKILPSFLSYLLISFLAYMITLERYLKQDFKLSKTAGLAFLKQPKLAHQHLASGLALNSFFSQLRFNLGSIVNFTSLLLVLLLALSQYALITNIYNEKTVGLLFDYVIFQADSADYEATKQFTTAQTVSVKDNSTSFIDITFSTNKRVYYKSSVFYFYDWVAPFLPLVAGENIDEETFSNLGDVKYYYEFVIATRRHLDLKGGSVYDAKKITKPGTIEKMYLFMNRSSTYAGSFTEQAVQIVGVANTLIDNGWTAFIQTPNSVNRFTFPVIDNYLVQVKPDQEPALLAYLKEHDLKYASFSEVAAALQANNNRITHESLAIIVSVSGLLILVLFISLGATYITNQLENTPSEAILNQIGVSKKIIKQKNCFNFLMRLTSSLLLALVGFLITYPLARDRFLKAYGLYQTLPLNKLVWLGFLGLAVVGIFGLLLSFYDRKRLN